RYSSLGKDSSSRFNFALTRFLPQPYSNATNIQFHPGLFQKRRGLYGPFPTNSVVTYTLLVNNDKVSVEIEWTLQTAKIFNSQQDWEAAYWNTNGIDNNNHD